MRLIITLAVCIISCSANYYVLPEDNYTAEKLINDSDELKSRLDCFLGKQSCTPLCAEYKKIVPETLNTSCAKCSPELKALIKAFVDGVKEKYPAEYKELVLKYDTELTQYNALERAVGALETIFSSLPSLPSLPSIPSISSLPSLPSLPFKF